MIEAGALGTNRDIHMGNPVDLERRRVVGDMGLRETLLAGAAALQAVWLVFVLTELPFALRLTLAALIALVLLTIALVRPQNLTLEQHIINFVQYQRRPKHRVHLTSERDRLRLAHPGLALLNAGSSSAARMAMIAMTTSNSINVNALLFRVAMLIFSVLPRGKNNTARGLPKVQSPAGILPLPRLRTD